jgi:hypothetical protein
MREKGIFRVVVAVLVLPLLFGVASAEAKKKHKKPKSAPVTVVTNTQSTSTENQKLTLTATCPPGLIAVGGGVTALPSFTVTTLNGIYVVYESRRSGENAWQASVLRENGGPELPVTTSVDCRTPKLAKKTTKKRGTSAKKKKAKKLRITEVTATGSAPAGSGGQIGSATATCPPKTVALGGGFSSSPAPDESSGSIPLFFESDRNTPTTWISSFANLGTTARELTSYAYCAAGLNVIETSGGTTLPGTATGVSVGQGTAIASACPTGRSMLGGGFHNSTPGTAGSIPILDKTAPVSGAWQVGAWNLSLTGGTLGATGYCA